METGREKFLIWLPVFGYLDKTNRSTIMPFVVQKDTSWCFLNIKRSRIETKTWLVDRENFQLNWLEKKD